MSAVPKSIRVVFFGDSICVGQGVSIHRGWVTRISARLSEISKQCGLEILVVNASVNGDTTRQALERMPYDVQSHPIDILIVQFGMNDCNIWQSDRGHPRVSPRAFAANLAEIIERGIIFGAKAVFLNTNHPSGRTRDRLPNSTSTYEQQNSLYNGIIRSTAKELGPPVKLIDVGQEFQNHLEQHAAVMAEFILPDLIHLSEKGHDIYYGVVQPLVEGAIIDIVARASKRARPA
jgi:acyl-CoA thioesterase-1